MILTLTPSIELPGEGLKSRKNTEVNCAIFLEMRCRTAFYGVHVYIEIVYGAVMALTTVIRETFSRHEYAVLSCGSKTDLYVVSSTLRGLRRK